MTNHGNKPLSKRFLPPLSILILCSLIMTGCGRSDRSGQASTNLDENTLVIALATTDQFKDIIANNHIVMVDFYADWCPPCKILKPVINDIAVQYRDQVTVVAVDIDRFGDIAGQFNINSIPTVNMFESGVFVRSLVGAQTKDSYTEVINGMLRD